MDLRIALRLVASVVLLSGSLSCVKTTAMKPVAAQPVSPVAPFERQIRNARDAGDGDYELNRLRQRVAADPDSAGARLDLANAYRQRGYPDVALELTRLAVARFPESGEARLALVADLHALKQRAEAVATLETFLQAHPQKDAAFYSWWGILLDESGQWASGEPQHRRAVDLAPARDSLHNNLGYNLMMQKRYGEAVGEFQQAIKLNPASEIARNNLGTALAAQNSSSQAMASFQAGTDRATAHNNLAAVLMENGNYTEARKELNIALGYNGAHPAALKNLELLSRLDGHDATLPKPYTQTRWQRFKAGLARLFGNSTDSKPDTSKPQAAQTGTAQ